MQVRYTPFDHACQSQQHIKDNFWLGGLPRSCRNFCYRNKYQCSFPTSGSNYNCLGFLWFTNICIPFSVLVGRHKLTQSSKMPGEKLFTPDGCDAIVALLNQQGSS